MNIRGGWFIIINVVRIMTEWFGVFGSISIVDR